MAWSAELIGLVMLVGRCHLRARGLHSARVQLEPGYTGIPSR